MTRLIVYSSLITASAIAVAAIHSGSVDYSAKPLQPALHGSSVYATGLVEGATEDVRLSPEISGRVVQIIVKTGDFVEAGDQLLRLDDRQQQQQVAASLAHLEHARGELQRLVNGAREQERQEARALLAAKEARLEQAERSWRRIQQLRSEAAVTEQEADDQEGLVNTLIAEVAAARARVEQLEAPAREDEVRVAEARVAVAEAEHELSKITLEKTILVAPSRGQILDLDIETGEIVSAHSARPVVVLSDTSRLQVRAYVEEIDAPRLKVGMTAKVFADGLPDKLFKGRIESLSPRMSPKLVTTGSADEMYDTKVREVLLSIDDAEELLVGLRVDVEFRGEPEAENDASP